MLNFTVAARDLGVGVNTVKAWLSVLEATHQVVVLRPYFANIGKRLVKTPKVFFADTGTLCYLMGLKDPDHARSGPMAGAIFETAVVNEVIRRYAHEGKEPRLYFWRPATGTEVDLVVDDGGRLIPIEVKSSSTPNREMVKGIEVFRKDFKAKATRGFLIHAGAVRLPLGFDAVALPLSAL